MEFKFGKEPTHEDSQPQPADKGRQTGLLVLLLVLVGGFGYLYFFTGMIRPQEQPPAPQPPPQVVKQPLPARDAVPPVATTPQKPSDAAATSTVPSAAPPGKPQQPAAVGTAVIPAAKPQQESTSAAAKPAPTAQKPAEAAKPAAQPAKTERPKPLVAKGETKLAAAKPEPKPASVQPAKPVAVENKPVALSTGPWTVVVGYYVAEETLAADMAKVKKAGLNPVMTSGPKRLVSMHRLYVGEYESRAEGQQVLAKIKQIGGSGFLVQRGELYDLFAGSYAVLNGAETEQQRLAAAGFKVSIRKVQVPLASRKLTAGTFTERKVAEAAVKKLKDAAVGTPVLE